jgi:hypothetical protein
VYLHRYTLRPIEEWPQRVDGSGDGSWSGPVRVLVVADDARVARDILDGLRSDPRVTQLAPAIGRQHVLAELRQGWANVVVIAHPLLTDDAFALSHCIKTSTERVRVALVVEDVTANLMLAALVSEASTIVRISDAGALVDDLARDGSPLRVRLSRPGAHLNVALNRLAVDDAAVVLTMLKGYSLEEAAHRLEIGSRRADGAADRMVRALVDDEPAGTRLVGLPARIEIS